MAKKVAYVVFVGLVPGVYDTWKETEDNTREIPGSRQKGYTRADGGRKQAEKAFREHINATQKVHRSTSQPESDIISISNPAFGGREALREIERQDLRGQGNAQAGTEKQAQHQSTSHSQQYGTLSTSGYHKRDQVESLHPRNHLPRQQDTLRDDVSTHECTDSSAPNSDIQAPHIAKDANSNSKKRLQQDGPALKTARKSPRLDSDQSYPGDHASPWSPRIDLEGVQPSKPPSTQQSPLKAAPEYSSLASPNIDDSGCGGVAERQLPAPPAPTSLAATEPELCKEQVDLVNLILSGANVFYTGSAGCGKSTVLKAFVKKFRERGNEVAIIAPTGRAALNVEGMTYFTYAGWYPGFMRLSIKKLEGNARFKKHVRKRLCDTDVLVIDEISMLENHHFESLDRVLKSARNNADKFGDERAAGNAKAPFGGVQLVVTGDFCQLPPVKPFEYCFTCGHELLESQDGLRYTCNDHGDFLDTDKWAFRSTAWRECCFSYVNLTHIHRQSDQTFITILNRLRLGRPLSTDDELLLRNHPSDTADAVKLSPFVQKVGEINAEEFAKLPGPTLTFDCVDDEHWEKEHLSLRRPNPDGSPKALNGHRFERRLQLKQGMLVVLLTNLDIKLGLVNGSQGIILGFLEHDPSKISEQNGHHADRKTSQVKKFINRAPVKKWPLVKFHNGVTKLIKAQCVIEEFGDSEPYSLVHRTQIPLLAAWAMTIHKAQGLTLSRVDVSISKAFEKGLAYVALSRATSLEGLTVRELDNCDEGLNEQVKVFLVEKFGNEVLEV